MKDIVSNQNRYSITAIEKALDVIEALAEHKSLNLIEMSKILEQPKSSLYRIITTLENRNYITRNDGDGKYCLSYKMLFITMNLMENNSLRNAATPIMNELVEKYGDTVNLGVLSDVSVIYVEIIEGTYSLRMSETVGSRSPFHATAIGKAITAHLPLEEVNNMIETQGLTQVTPNTVQDYDIFINELNQTKQQGYSLDDEEVVLAARCIAAPIFDLSGKVVAAISLSGASQRFSDEKIPKIANDVKNAADRISKKLGFIS